MNYHDITTDDMLNGDGLRVVLWVSGCTHHCEGCQNPITWDITGGLPFDKNAEDELFEKLNKNIPIIVENVDYGGHYKVIIGYDCVNDNPEEDMLIFADPSDFNDGDRDGYTIFPAERFFYMWFDDHCLSSQYRKQPFIAVEKIRKDEEKEN